MIAAFRKTPGWVTVPAVGLLLAVGAATLTSAVTVVAADVAAVPMGEPAIQPGGVAGQPCSCANPMRVRRNWTWW